MNSWRRFALAIGTVAALNGPHAQAEPPLLYRQVAARHGVSAVALYAQALRYSGRQSRFASTPTPWPWTVRMCRQSRCETVHAQDRAQMVAILIAARRVGLTLYVGPLGWFWSQDSNLPLRAATSPRITLDAAVGQWLQEQRHSQTVKANWKSGARHARAPRLNTDRARRWHPIIARVAREEGVDPALVHAVVAAESAYDPDAVSPKGAVGLMQLMPATAERFGLPGGRRAEPERNLRAGSRYLRWLLDYFQQDLELTLAGYNAGEGAVLKYGRRIPPYQETQVYVRRVRGFLATLGDPS